MMELPANPAWEVSTAEALREQVLRSIPDAELLASNMSEWHVVSSLVGTIGAGKSAEAAWKAAAKFVEQWSNNLPGECRTGNCHTRQDEEDMPAAGQQKTAPAGGGSHNSKTQ